MRAADPAVDLDTSTRSSSPASTRSPAFVSRSSSRANSCPSLSGGGAGRGSRSAISTSRRSPLPRSLRARKNHVSPRNGAASRRCAATNAATGVAAPFASASKAWRSVVESPSPGAGSSSSSLRRAGATNGRPRTALAACSASAVGAFARTAVQTATAASSVSAAVRPGHRVRSASSQLALGVRIDSVLLDLVEQRPVADLQQLGGAGAVAPGLRAAPRGCRSPRARAWRA